MVENNMMIRTYIWIRRFVGYQLLFMPFILVFSHGEILGSLSHYYYTDSAVFFLAILAPAGMFLISFDGSYQKVKSKKLLTDNVVTTIGGIGILILLYVPTKCSESCSELIQTTICDTGAYPLYGHDSDILFFIHMLGANFFMGSVIWIIFYRLGRLEVTKKRKQIARFYRWVSFLLLGLMCLFFAIVIFDTPITGYDTFIMELIFMLLTGISLVIRDKNTVVEYYDH